MSKKAQRHSLCSSIGSNLRSRGAFWASWSIIRKRVGRLCLIPHLTKRRRHRRLRISHSVLQLVLKRVLKIGEYQIYRPLCFLINGSHAGIATYGHLSMLEYAYINVKNRAEQDHRKTIM